MVKVLVLTHDAGMVSYCERCTHDEQLKYEETRYMRSITSYITSASYTGDLPDWLVQFTLLVRQTDPDIIFVATQKVEKSDRLHSHALQHEFSKISYTLLRRGRYMGLDTESSTSYMGSIRGLRNSVYVRDDMYERIVEHEKYYTTRMGDDCHKYTSYGSYIYSDCMAVTSYVKYPGVPLIALINCKFPHNPLSMSESKRTNNRSSRLKDLLINAASMNHVFHDAVLSNQILKSSEIPPDFENPFEPKLVIMAGDLNFRIQYNEDPIPSNMGEYRSAMEKYDELMICHRMTSIPTFHEGVDDRGPTFAPTSDMKPGRNHSSCKYEDYVIGDDKSSLPCWSERILYRGNVSCLLYDRFDYGTITKCTQTGVIGLYDLKA